MHFVQGEKNRHENGMRKGGKLGERGSMKKVKWKVSIR